jgi:hypothetical protein
MRSGLPGATALPAATIALSAADLLVLALLHVLRTDVDPVTRPTGDYAHGSTGWLTVAATVGIGVAAIALAVTVRPQVRGTAGQIGVGLLVFFGVAKVVQAVFPSDPAGRVTAGGVVHDTLGDVSFFILPVAAVCVSVGLRARWPLGLAVALALAVLLVLGGAAGFGLAQRVYLVLGSGWLLVTALTARSSHPVPG